MQIVIKLSDESYDKVVNPDNWYDPSSAIKDIVTVIKEGTPIEQEPTQMIDKSNFSQEQYKTDLQSAYDCGKSILDKIRAEIEELKPNNPNFKGYFEQNVALNKTLEVIDKYKSESENTK